MAKGVAGNVGGNYNEHRKFIFIGAIVLGVCLLTMAAIHVFLPNEYRACALMPGFCKKDNEPHKTPFRKLDEGYHGAPKFGLTSGR